MSEPLILQGTTKLSKGVEVLKANLCQLQTCSPLSYKETLEIIRAENPAGTENNWGESDREDREVQCSENPKNKHYLYQC